jgi:hypothetical protein
MPPQRRRAYGEADVGQPAAARCGAWRGRYPWQPGAGQGRDEGMRHETGQGGVDRDGEETRVGSVGRGREVSTCGGVL